MSETSAAKSAPTQHGLVTQDGAGDAIAERHRLFQDLYRREVGFVWNVLRKLGAKHGDLEDLVHEVFATAMRQWNTFDTTRPVRPWLYGIAFRVLSGSTRRQGALSDPDAGLAIPDGRADALEQLTAAETRNHVAQVLDALPVEQKILLLMHDLDDIGAKEIAAELELPVTTVYARIRTARQNFREAFQTLQQRQAS